MLGTNTNLFMSKVFYGGVKDRGSSTPDDFIRAQQLTFWELEDISNAYCLIELGGLVSQPTDVLCNS